MTTTIKTQKLISEKLLSTNNEINLAKIIMEYLMGDCDICKKKYLDIDLTTTEIGYNNDTIDLCEKCMEDNTCSCCDNFIGIYVDKENKIDMDFSGYCCGDQRCRDQEDIYCEDCRDEYLYWCSECDDTYCCRKIYGIGDEFYCERCVNTSCVFNPRGNS